MTCSSGEAEQAVQQMINTGVVELMNEGLGSKVDVLVSPDNLEYFKIEISKTGAKVDVLNEDISIDIESENSESTFLRLLSDKYFFLEYHNLKDQHAYLDDLVSLHPKKAETFSIGKSFEGKDLKAIRISDDVTKSSSKPMIWIDGGIHAREWISPSTVIYIAAALLGEVDSSLAGDVQDLVKKYQFVILPTSNPDGYEFSRTSHRFWRKTRRPSGCERNRTKKNGECRKKATKCYGIDPNRNFDSAFNTLGVSPNPCSPIYPGKTAFSENNTAAMRDFLAAQKDKVKLYLSYHAYSQLFLLPLGYKDVENRKHRTAHDDAGAAYVKAVSDTHGYKYKSMPSSGLYPTSGSSMDWAYDHGIVNSYTVELRDKGVHGFILPAEQIVPTGEENVRGLIALIKQLKYKF